MSKARSHGRCMERLDRDGVPIDPSDWTYEDWADLHFGIAAIKARIAARHASESAPKPSEPKEAPR